MAVLSLGPIGVSAARVVECLQAEGHSVAHVDLVFAKPLDEECLHKLLASVPNLLVIEEGCLSGGVGSAILQLAMEAGYKGRIKTLGLPDEFISHGTPAEQKRYCGLDEDSIYDAAKALLGTTIEG